MEKERVVFLDWLRVLACFLVICVHSIEPFYLGGPNGTFIASTSDALWVGLVNSFCRCCVPLFVMVSAFLLFPLKYDSGTFLRKRFTRVLVPAAVWLVMYAVVPMYGCDYDPSAALKELPFNFTGAAGHLWFVFMVMGLYIMMPLLSPWAREVSRKELSIYIGIWLITTTIPFIRQLAPEGTLFVPEIGGSLWGEANWNEFGLFYGISGFIGYMLVALYFKRFVPADLSWGRTLAVALPCIIVSYCIAAGLFLKGLPSEFPLDDAYRRAISLEIPWRFCSTGIVLLTIGMFTLMRKVRFSGKFYSAVVRPLSEASYGTYLMHIFFLLFFSALWRGQVPGCEAAALPSTGLVILCTAVCTFITASTVSILIRKIPVAGKWIAG